MSRVPGFTPGGGALSGPRVLGLVMVDCTLAGAAAAFRSSVDGVEVQFSFSAVSGLDGRPKVDKTSGLSSGLGSVSRAGEVGGCNIMGSGCFS
jgi:hypothetical protein